MYGEGVCYCWMHYNSYDDIKQAISNVYNNKLYLSFLHNRKYVVLEIDCKIYSSISFMEQSAIIYLAVGYIIIVVLIFHAILCIKHTI